jgi:hypothetical protein
MAALITMGFDYKGLNLRVLQKFNGDLRNATNFLSDRQNIYTKMQAFNENYFNGEKTDQNLLDVLFETGFDLEKAQEKLMSEYTQKIKTLREKDFNAPSDNELITLLKENNREISKVINVLMDQDYRPQELSDLYKEALAALRKMGFKQSDSELYEVINSVQGDLKMATNKLTSRM